MEVILLMMVMFLFSITSFFAVWTMYDWFVKRLFSR